MKRRGLWCLAALGMALAGCGSNASCKDACDNLSGCSLNSSGFSCDATLTPK